MQVSRFLLDPTRVRDDSRGASLQRKKVVVPGDPPVPEPPVLMLPVPESPVAAPPLPAVPLSALPSALTASLDPHPVALATQAAAAAARRTHFDIKRPPIAQDRSAGLVRVP